MRGKEVIMYNFSSKKSRGILAKVIVVVLAVAMVLTLLTPFF